MKIYALMVIYNKNVKDSSVYQFLLAKEEISLVVCDNSTSDQGNAQRVEQDGGLYVALPENGGLAKAYNAGIRKIFACGGTENDYVCIFDDDSVPEDNYFEVLMESIYRDASDIFFPVVEDGIGIMSPVILPRLYCRRIKSQAELLRTPRRKLTGVNSGMAVRLSIYKDFSYNEEYFMDYIDHDFILKMRQKNIFPKMMDTHIRQNFSAVTDGADEALSRFASQRKDLRIFYRDKRFGRVVYAYVVFRKRIKLFLKYRRISMLYR